MTHEQKLFWVNKTVHSKELTQSEGNEKSKLFSHVQQKAHNRKDDIKTAQWQSHRQNKNDGVKYQNMFGEPVSFTSHSVSRNSPVYAVTRIPNIVGLQCDSTESSIRPRRKTQKMRLASSASVESRSQAILRTRLLNRSGTSRIRWNEGGSGFPPNATNQPSHYLVNAPSPAHTISEETTSHFSSRELRSLQFFRERTAVEWVGWHDQLFWNCIALQVSSPQHSLRHALVAIGAHHESLETQNRDTRKSLSDFRILQAGKAMASLHHNHDKMSIRTILVCCIVNVTLGAYIDVCTLLQSLKISVDLMDQLRNQVSRNKLSITPADWDFIVRYLEPLVDRQRSRLCQAIGSWNALRLSRAERFYVSHSVQVPSAFASLWQARETLEDILHTITYEVMTQDVPVGHVTPHSEDLFQAWITALDGLLTDSSGQFTVETSLSLSVLRAAGRMNLVIIKTLYTTSEMVFDQYIAEFTALDVAFESLIVFEQSTTRQHTTVRFGCDNGLLNLVAFAAFRCRDPLLRSHLIALLAKADRSETAEGSLVWAGICRAAQVIEEEGLTEETGNAPRTAADIKEEKRLRLYRMDFYWKSGLVHLIFSYPPYYSSSPPTPQGNHRGSFYTHDLDPVVITHAHCFREAWIPNPSLPGNSIANDSEYGGRHTSATPDAIFGPDPKVAFLEQPAHDNLAVPQYHDTWPENEQGPSPPRYITIEMNKFFFAIPRM